MLPDAVTTVPVGPTPIGVAVLPDGSVAYVALNGGSENAVAVVSLADPRAAPTRIKVGTSPYGIAVAPGGTRAYVSNSGAGTVSVVDTAARAVVATITVGANPQGLTVSADGRRLYVANASTNRPTGSVSVVDLAAAVPAVTATVEVGGLPSAVALTPDGSRLLVTEPGSGTLTLLDPTLPTPAVTASVAVGGQPYAVCVSADGQSAYVSNRKDGTVSAVAIGTSPPGAYETIPVGPLPAGIAATPGGGPVYVVSGDPGLLTALGAVRDQQPIPVDAVPVGGSPVGVAVAPDRSAVVVTNSRDGTLSIVPTDEVVVGGTPRGMAAVPGRDRLLVADETGNAVAVLDTAVSPPVVTQRVPVDGGPTRVATTPDGARALVVAPQAGALAVLDLSTPGPATAGPVLAVGDHPHAVAVTPDGRRALVTVAGAASVAVVDLASPTPSVTATVPAGVLPGGIAVSADGRRAFVGDLHTNQVRVLDLTVDEPVDSGGFTLGNGPGSLVATVDGRRIHVALSGDGTIVAIEDGTGFPSPVDDPYPAGEGVSELALSPDGTRLLAAVRGRDVATVIDLTGARQPFDGGDDGTDRGQERQVGRAPDGAAFGADGTAYVANSGSGTVSVLRVPPCRQVGRGPVVVAVDRPRSRLWIGSGREDTVTVVRTDERAAGLPWRVPVPSYVIGVHPLADGRVVVLSAVAETLTVLDVADGARPGRPVAVGPGPSALAVTPDGRTAFVAARLTGELAVLDLTDGPPTVLATHAVGAADDVVATATRVVATHGDDGTCTVLDTSVERVGTLLKVLPTGNRPTGVASAPDGGRAVVVNTGSASLTVIGLTGSAPAVLRADARIGGTPVAAAFSPDGTRLHVLQVAREDGPGAVAHLDASTLRVLRMTPVGLGASGIAVDPVDGAVYVTARRSSSLTTVRSPV